MFSTTAELEDDLNKKDDTANLRYKFKTKGITLSNAVTVTKEGMNEWTITDENDKSEFAVRKEEGKLNIYAQGYVGADIAAIVIEAVVSALREAITFGTYLSNIDVNGRLEDDLDKGIISEELRMVLQIEEKPFSDLATVTKESDDKWVITDEKTGYNYIIGKENEKLNIYKPNKDLDDALKNLLIEKKHFNAAIKKVKPTTTPKALMEFEEKAEDLVNYG